jgi:hypothetical protein
MCVNSLTSNFLARARVPLALPNDRAVIAACLDTCWRTTWDQSRMVLIPNTLELNTLWVTPPMAPEVEANPDLSFQSPFLPIPFDCHDNLQQDRLFPESQRARRSRAGHGADSGD